MDDQNHQPLFISCAQALEPLLIEELKQFGYDSVNAGYRGVFLNGWDWDAIYRINYCSRYASRVLLPLCHFKCFDRRSLYRHASEINWAPFLKGGATFAIDANVSHHALRNSLYAAQVMKDAICDQMRQKEGRRPNVQVQNPDVQLNLYIQHQNAVISFDTSGEPLHKRGYRQETVEAPIQETLAAAILRLAGYDGDQVLFDPCCGSGTFLIEAALMASHTPPGYLRKTWGFMRHPSFDSSRWLKVRNKADERRSPLLQGRIFGIDRSQGAVRVSKINLKAAGFNQSIDVKQADFREFHPDVKPDLIVTNPPHGKRLEDEDLLKPLYRELGDFLKRSCAKSGRGFVFTTSQSLAKEVGLAAARRHILTSGGMEGRLLEFEIF